MAVPRIGIDVGGTGVKGALVDVETASLLSDRLRIETPAPSTPAAVAEVVAEIVSGLGGSGPVGIGFPSVLHDGVAFTASNIDQAWIGVDARALFEEAVGRQVRIINDADAAGLTEIEFGAAQGVNGFVIQLTFGTGIGSALFFDGRLVPNVELGQLELEGVRPAELRYSAKSREVEGLEWPDWADRANEFLKFVDFVFSPDLVVFGGGAVKKWDQIVDRLDPDLPVVPAKFKNNAGIIGAALLVRG